MKILEYAKSHPYVVGGGVFVLGALFLLSRGGGGSQQGGGTDAALGQAYYAALAAQSHDSAAVQVAQIQADSGTAQTQLTTGAATHIQDTWAATNLAENAQNNQAAIAMAPYATEQELIATLGQVAQLPGSTVTNTSHSSGFFGIGGGSKTTTTYVPNPAAQGASNTLADLINSLYAAH